MSDIKVGDLVMVVKLRTCCGAGVLGEPEIVVDANGRKAFVTCDCGNVEFNDPLIYVKLSDGTYCQKSRLIKIDPPALDETTESERELTV
jgi:hypothetical protein